MVDVVSGADESRALAKAPPGTAVVAAAELAPGVIEFKVAR